MPKAERLAAILCTLAACTSDATARDAVPASGNDPIPSDASAAEDTVERSPLSTNHQPSTHIRFHTAAEAEETRSRLVHWIWPGGLPETMPEVTPGVDLPAGAVDVDLDDVQSVDHLYATIPGSPLHARSFLFRPAVTNANTDRLVIVHQGHARTLEAGVGATAGHLLRAGFTVIAMTMPLFGWNGIDSEFFESHDAMFLGAAADDGTVFRPFFEPVVQNVNLVRRTMPAIRDISMIGLSGGGWTTAMMAAIDPRIAVSVQVAGSAPLYVWDDERWPTGDREQFHTPLFDEDIGADGSGGGVATLLEIYALGGYGAGRRAIQVTNEFDPCCFRGRFADSYRTIVEESVAALGAGSWSHVLDGTHAEHRISEHAIATVIDPALGIEADD